MEPKSIAVMPFANLSPDLEIEYFCDGITDDLINALSQLADLRVISRTSAFHYKDQSLDIPIIAHQLDVSHVLEGSVRRSDNQLRISAKLVRALDDSLILSEQYDVELGDIFDVQDHIVNEITAALKVEFSDQAHVIAHQPLVDFEAYNLYLRGRFHWNKRTEADFVIAQTSFESAIKIAPQYARAQAGLADVHTFMVNWGFAPQVDGLAKARAHAKRALDIDQNSIDAHLAMERIVRNYDWDWPAVEHHTQRALELNSGYVRALEVKADFLRIKGESEGAIEQMNRALRLDPLNVISHSAQSRNYAHARKFDEALELAKRAIDMDQNLTHARYFLGEIYFHLNDFENALKHFELVTFPALHNFGLILAHSGLGDNILAQQHLDFLTGEIGNQAAYQIALGHFHLNKLDEGFDWLDRAYELRDGGLTNIKVDPLTDPVRDDPRFARMLEKLKLN